MSTISDTFRNVLSLHLEKHGAKQEDVKRPNWPQRYRLAVFAASHESYLFCNEVVGRAIGVSEGTIYNLKNDLSGHPFELLVNKV